MWLVDALVQEYVRAGVKIEAYEKKLDDSNIDEYIRREFRGFLVFLYRQRRLIEKALAVNGYDLEKSLLERTAEDAITKAYRDGFVTPHGDVDKE